MKKRILSLILTFAMMLNLAAVTGLTVSADALMNAPTDAPTTLPAPGDYVVPGDLNGDGKVNLLDLILMRKYIAKWDVSIVVPNAHLNHDFKIDLLDLILLRKYLAKWNVHMGPQG